MLFEGHVLWRGRSGGGAEGADHSYEIPAQRSSAPPRLSREFYVSVFIAFVHAAIKAATRCRAVAADATRQADHETRPRPKSQLYLLSSLIFLFLEKPPV